jgi:hypothetical protein
MNLGQKYYLVFRIWDDLYLTDSTDISWAKLLNPYKNSYCTNAEIPNENALFTSQEDAINCYREMFAKKQNPSDVDYLVQIIEVVFGNEIIYPKYVFSDNERDRKPTFKPFIKVQKRIDFNPGTSKEHTKKYKNYMEHGFDRRR